MTKITVGTPVTAPLTPGRDDTNVWPTHLAKYGAGGLEVVETTSDRDGISDARKTDKAVLVRSDDGGRAALYEWSSGGWNKVDIGDFSGMTITDGANVFNDIVEIKLANMTANQYPNDSIDSVTLTAEGSLDWATMGDPSSGSRATSVLVEPPLQTYPDPDNTGVTRLRVKEGSYEPMKAPGYLAYVDFPEKVIGKLGYHTLGHYDSAIWPTDTVVSGGGLIPTIADKKLIGLQEYDGKDPNKTGGTDFLVAFRVAFKGHAVNAGKIKAYLAKQPASGTSDSADYLRDVNGELLVREVNYKAGDEYGHIEVLGIVNAKGLTNMSMHIEHNFSDSLLIEERAVGLSGVMVQALESKSKTGAALMQYEIDTKQNIEFNKIYYGDSIMDFNWEATHGLPMEEIQAGVGANLPDGFHFKNLSNIYISSKDDHIYVHDAGTVCDFSLGKIFNAFDTRSLHGKEINVKATIIDKDAPFTIGVVKWTGKPDQYTNNIFSSRNSATVVFDAGWELVGSLFFPSESVTGDHTLTKKFTVPSDANNFAVIIYPGVPNSPLTLKIKDFDVDVVNPFYGYEMYVAGKLNELHLEEDTEFAHFSQANENYVSLRYTIGKSADGDPMPVGVLRKGKADITLDPSINKIVGSAATSGEGGLKFGKDGKAIVDTTLWIHSEQPEKTASDVTFWYELVNSHGIATKIIPSETTFKVSGDSSGDYSMKEFSLDVITGDRIVLKASADKDDGAFIQSNSPAHPLVDIEIRIDELTAFANDDPFTGVELDQFDKVYTGVLTATKYVSHTDSATFHIEVPDDMNVSVLEAIKKLDDGTVTTVKSLDWSYNLKSQMLTVYFGEVVEECAITLGIYTV
ncbi:hypothetical protein KNV09_gp167 [Vibrio phage Athena]|uniref:Uncharacterized protein n=1 Tax=Vibrio phage Athena TaxID=2736262 RepID=A0A6M9Z2T3_9CAUD|nr:hypothetical protein KNV09_gp167 [Vibrio phage Athena]QKN85762.1 hypothetical protein ATHENA_144 [Vibrio phage Athena]